MSPYVPKPDLEGINSPEKPTWFKDAVLLVAGFLGIVLTFYFVFTTAADWLVTRISPESEMRYLGRLWSQGKLSKEIIEDSKVNPKFKAFTDKFVAQTNLPLKVFIVCDKTPNAYALPGGVIYITSGLFGKVHSENGLAFVLGHEIGHFIHRDHLRGLSRQIFFAMGGALFGFADVGGAAALNKALSRQFSRAQELGADDYALKLMQSFYRHTFGAEEFLFEMSKDETLIHETLARFASTHPISSDRIQRIKMSQTTHPKESKLVEGSVSEWIPKGCP